MTNEIIFVAGIIFSAFISVLVIVQNAFDKDRQKA
jgi:hypothetical protein